MSDKKRDALDNLIDFILSDETPVGPEDEAAIQLFDNAVEKGEGRLAKARLERARAGAFNSSMGVGVKDLDLERAKRTFERAKLGDRTTGVTLAARFGDGSMDGDQDAYIEDIAELEDDEDEEN